MDHLQSQCFWSYDTKVYKELLYSLLTWKVNRQIENIYIYHKILQVRVPAKQTWHIDGSVQDYSISIANALGLMQSSTKPSIYILLNVDTDKKRDGHVDRDGDRYRYMNAGNLYRWYYDSLVTVLYYMYSVFWNYGHVSLRIRVLNRMRTSNWILEDFWHFIYCNIVFQDATSWSRSYTLSTFATDSSGIFQANAVIFIKKFLSNWKHNSKQICNLQPAV